MTAISLIKQSKVAHDDRCKILTSSLQVSFNYLFGKGDSFRVKAKLTSSFTSMTKGMVKTLVHNVTGSLISIP